MSVEADQQDVIYHWIQVSRSLYTSRTGSAGRYITMDPYRQEPIIQKKTDPQDVILH